jgi:hypothetical protein
VERGEAEKTRSEREKEELALELKVRAAESESLRETLAEERKQLKRQAELLDRLREKAGPQARWARVLPADAKRNKVRLRLQAANSRLLKAERECDRLGAELRRSDEQLRVTEARLRRLETVRERTAAVYIDALPRRRFRTLVALAWRLARLRLRDVRAYAAIRRSGRFDVRYYLTRYPEVVVARKTPILDYIDQGVAEQRNPRADFDTSRYMARHPELAETGEDPFLHYLRSQGAA